MASLIARPARITRGWNFHHYRQGMELPRFAIATRYPHFLPPVSKQEYRRAIKIAEDVTRWSEREIQNRMKE